MRYVSFIHRDDDTGYGISFPDFPGCVSVIDIFPGRFQAWRTLLPRSVQ